MNSPISRQFSLWARREGGAFLSSRGQVRPLLPQLHGESDNRLPPFPGSQTTLDKGGR
jgi:hypothetical protein